MGRRYSGTLLFGAPRWLWRELGRAYVKRGLSQLMPLRIPAPVHLRSRHSWRGPCSRELASLLWLRERQYLSGVIAGYRQLPVSKRAVMTITVGICTRNRAAMLRTSLERLAQAEIPADTAWEVIVVDNGSTDETPAVLEALSSRLPLRALELTTPGKSHALNHATEQARGDYILWTDDDVLVDRGWIAAYAAAFRRWPDAAFFGGPVEPWFDGTPPAWLANHWQRVANVFAVRQLGDQAFLFDSAHVPYGANFAVQTEVQRQYRYDPTLGPRPGSEVRGEETQVIRQMLAAGQSGWWVPEARVQHFVPRHRQTLSYLRRFFVGQGEVQSREFGSADVPRVFGKPRWLVKQALAAEARYRWSRLTASPDVWLERLIEAATAWGHVKAAP